MSLLKRTHNESFVMLEKTVIDSEAFRSLNGSALKVYIQLRRKSFGSIYNNPKPFKYAISSIEKDTGLSHSAVCDGLKELRKKSFVEVVQQGGLKAFSKSTSTYRLLTDFLKIESRPKIKPVQDRKTDQCRYENQTGCLKSTGYRSENQTCRPL